MLHLVIKSFTLMHTTGIPGLHSFKIIRNIYFTASIVVNIRTDGFYLLKTIFMNQMDLQEMVKNK